MYRCRADNKSALIVKFVFDSIVIFIDVDEQWRIIKKMISIRIRMQFVTFKKSLGDRSIDLE